MKAWTQLLIAVGCVVLISACMPAWYHLPQGKTVVLASSYELLLPSGWSHFDALDPNRVIASRDGLALNRIFVSRKPHKDAFPGLKKDSRHGLDALELAELWVGNLRAENENVKVELIESAPAVIGGHEGFRLHIQYTIKTGLVYERIDYGFTDESGFVLLLFEAPKLHFFSRDLRDFEGVIRSLRSIAKT